MSIAVTVKAGNTTPTRVARKPLPIRVGVRGRVEGMDVVMDMVVVAVRIRVRLALLHLR